MPAENLARMQRRFWRFVTAPRGVAAARASIAGDDPDAVPLTGWLAGDEDQATQRLDVYANMYFYRLLDVLRGDFARTARLLGDDYWNDLVVDYLLAHPSRDPSLRHLGVRLPEFLAGHAFGPRFLGADDLSRFEWARIEVFDREDVVPATRAALQTIPPESWPHTRLAPIPAVRALCLANTTASLWAALAPDTSSERPPHNNAPTGFLIHRDAAFRVWHRRVPACEARAMQAAIDGEGADVVIGLLAEDGTDDMEADARRAFGRLARWVDDGLIAAFESP